MIDYVIKNESCVKMGYIGSKISADVHLMNGVTPQEFISNMKKQVADSSYIDSADICTILSGKDRAFYGKFTFTNVGKYYVIFDDVEWLKVVDVKDVCMFIEGKIDPDGINAIMELLLGMMPDPYKINCMYSLQESEANIIKINLLLA
ncbi:MAG: hypothetical protein K6G45_02275 [Lachnospiraceae bacterium]|nr:hypothetical protein [Lachnospiraceae bacterium]